MKKILFILTIFFIGNTLLAQEQETPKSNWSNKGIVSLNISQISFTDWTQGGDNAITYTFMGDFGFNYAKDVWSFKNNLKLAYGQTKIAEDDFKTNNNELYLESVYTRDIGIWVDPFISNLIRTPIAPGFDYKVTPWEEIANFFDPGYISQSIGVGINKSEIVKTRLGLGFQEVITSKYRKYSDDPKTTDKEEAFKFETGIESVTDFNWNFMENMNLKSKLRLFSRFESMDVWDVRWDNTISAQVNKYIVVNLNLLAIYEKNQSLRTQIKEALQIGITYTLF
ncbi:DUF3078 domain-containing protein [Bacteroidetes/Chlorobi group bacterium ChocPot_Mid]|nr:MAG: DUF3078 domain-containing protein [Bacteroidetes/Chlorobi group bacterium ChocPot_Mid]